MTEKPTPREGEVYKTLSTGGKQFTIVYGYYCDAEREACDPMPIFPDLKQWPQYTDDGRPIVTRIQDACEHYKPCEGCIGEGWCADCCYYPSQLEEMAVCQNEQNKISRAQAKQEA